MKILIKLGGTLIDDPASRANLAAQIAAVCLAGHQVVVVHGDLVVRMLLHFAPDVHGQFAH